MLGGQTVQTPEVGQYQGNRQKTNES